MCPNSKISHRFDSNTCLPWCSGKLKCGVCSITGKHEDGCGLESQSSNVDCDSCEKRFRCWTKRHDINAWMGER